jgi:hypothetical protein
LCVYTSRLLGGEPKLVLHGGGNTSVKTILRANLASAPGPSAISGMIVGAVIFALPIIILAPTGKERKLCDQAVSTLFTTTDAIELQRAMFLIRHLDCKISTRL